MFRNHLVKAHRLRHSLKGPRSVQIRMFSSQNDHANAAVPEGEQSDLQSLLRQEIISGSTMDEKS